MGWLQLHRSCVVGLFVCVVSSVATFRPIAVLETTPSTVPTTRSILEIRMGDSKRWCVLFDARNTWRRRIAVGPIEIRPHKASSFQKGQLTEQLAPERIAPRSRIIDVQTDEQLQALTGFTNFGYLNEIAVAGSVARGWPCVVTNVEWVSKGPLFTPRYVLARRGESDREAGWPVSVTHMLLNAIFWFVAGSVAAFVLSRCCRALWAVMARKIHIHGSA